jgi:hypothetical protein
MSLLIAPAMKRLSLSRSYLVLQARIYYAKLFLVAQKKAPAKTVDTSSSDDSSSDDEPKKEQLKPVPKTTPPQGMISYHEVYMLNNW